MSSQESLPKHYEKFKKNEPELFAAWEAIGKAVRLKGPLDLKTGHLIQLAASAALRSEGGVHSHVRRALEAGATPEEVRQSILLISGTAGFPTMMAALSWVDDVLGQKP